MKVFDRSLNIIAAVLCVLASRYGYVSGNMVSLTNAFVIVDGTLILLCLAVYHMIGCVAMSFSVSRCCLCCLFRVVLLYV